MSGPTRRFVRGGVLVLGLLGLSACASNPIATETPAGSGIEQAQPDVRPDARPDARLQPDARPQPGKSPTPPSRDARDSAAAPEPKREGAPATGSRPELLRATLSIPSIDDMAPVPVIAYRGSPDDAPGTEIQDGGVAASPFGPGGGVGPGQVGNYIVTAHRTTSPAPFADLPSMQVGEHAYVTAAGKVFDYRVSDTRWTSFRSQQSLERQAAAVSGRPGVPARRAAITLSTCATLEDHARGNYWSDEFGNPEHRIDKIGLLVDVRPA